MTPSPFSSGTGRGSASQVGMRWGFPTYTSKFHPQGGVLLPTLWNKPITMSFDNDCYLLRRHLPALFCPNSHYPPPLPPSSLPLLQQAGPQQAQSSLASSYVRRLKYTPLLSSPSTSLLSPSSPTGRPAAGAELTSEFNPLEAALFGSISITKGE